MTESELKNIAEQQTNELQKTILMLRMKTLGTKNRGLDAMLKDFNDAIDVFRRDYINNNYDK